MGPRGTDRIYSMDRLPPPSESSCPVAQQPRPWQITNYLKSGPRGKSPAPTTEQIVSYAREFPDKYDYAMIVLYYSFAEAMFKRAPTGWCERHRRFVSPWIDKVDRDSSRFLRSTLDAYEEAWKAGMGELSVESSPEEAVTVSSALAELHPVAGGVEELPVLLLRGQAESLWSREVAATTFAAVRANPYHDLVRRFTWDQGALSYFSEEQLANSGGVKDTDPDISWARWSQTSHDRAYVISVDPVFFRIYGPMILFNAQQIPETDLVVLLCTDEDTAQDLVATADAYAETLSNFNAQPRPANVSYYAVNTPSWVTEMHAYYACVRFLALPDLLEHYTSVYCIDADLIMRNDPAAFMKKTERVILSVPRNEGSIGIVPWRRHMAGNLVANRQLLDTDLLAKFNRYISVGLGTKFAWTLDQNALSYIAEIAEPGTFEPLNPYDRPTIVSSFMSRWERNYRTHNAS